MVEKTTIEVKKETIRGKGLDKIEEYFDLNASKLEGLDPEILKHIYNMARLGLQFDKEMNVTKRATENSYLRVSKMVTDNREELKAYIKKTLPQYCK